MPRAKSIVMDKHNPRDLHEHAILSAVKLHSPYMVVAGSLVGSDYPFAVVYTAPRGGDRQVVGERNKRANANSLRDQLSRAWVEGYYSSMYGKGL